MHNVNYNYVSLDVIANKIYKNPLLKDVNYEDIIDFALSVIKIAKVRGVYIQDSCYKDITDYKTSLPKNALNIKTVDRCYNNSLIPMIVSSNTLNNEKNKINNNNYNYSYNVDTKNTYSINNNIITTSCKEGRIFLTYDTIKTDDNGIPMIPDSEALLRAIEAYIKVQIYSVLVDLQKVSERALNRAEGEYFFNIGKAQTEFQEFQNEDEMESFINGWKRQFQSNKEHSNRYESESYKERIKRL